MIPLLLEELGEAKMQYRVICPDLYQFCVLADSFVEITSQGIDVGETSPSVTVGGIIPERVSIGRLRLI